MGQRSSDDDPAKLECSLVFLDVANKAGRSGVPASAVNATLILQHHLGFDKSDVNTPLPISAEPVFLNYIPPSVSEDGI